MVVRCCIGRGGDSEIHVKFNLINANGPKWADNGRELTGVKHMSKQIINDPNE